MLGSILVSIGGFLFALLLLGVYFYKSKQTGIDNKFFKINKDKAIVEGEEIDFNLDNVKEDSKIIEVKKYDSDVLDKYLLTCIKALQNKIKELEAKI